MASADLSIAEVLGVEPLAALAGTTVPTLVVTYALMLGALLWAQTRPVGRIDNVHGDRNLVCTCEGMEAYQQD